MTNFVRILAAVLIATLAVGPVSAATLTNVSTTSIAQDATTGSVSGTIRDNSGAPVANVSVKLHGPASYAATTDGTGAFAVASVLPGIYTVTASKTGFQSAEIDDFAVVAGTAGTLNATIQQETLTSLNLQTIARVTAHRNTQFNASTASVNIVTAQAFKDQGSPQVTRVLNGIPGVQISLPSSSGNGAVPGAITFPNIRGALSYESASLIDGHPVSVGKYGDYVTTFLNSYILGGVEIVKGPGEESPETNYAIGGTINFRTKDPTSTLVPDYTFGVDSHGGIFSNFGVSDTIGKVGFVLDFATINEPSAVNGSKVWFYPEASGAVCTGSTCNSLYGNSEKATYVAGTDSKLYNNFPLAACCYSVYGNYTNTSELVKLRYAFSGATALTFSFLGSQTAADQNGNTSSLTPSLFTPTAAYYNPAFPSNSQFLMSSVFAGTPEIEHNNEPIFQAELRTTRGNDTILARYYHADIARIIQTNGNVNTAGVQYAQLYGNGFNSANAPTVYTGQTVPLYFYNFYAQSEIDTLQGVSFEYTHPFSANNTVTLSAESTNSQTTTGTLSSDDAYSAGPVQSNEPFWGSITPKGAGQIFNTYLIRDNAQIGSKINAAVSVYENTYRSTFPLASPAPLTAVGAPVGYTFPAGPYDAGWKFQTHQTQHTDLRAAMTYRANRDLSIRASAGSAIAPPYISLLSTLNGGIFPGPAGSGTYSQTHNAGTLLPETAFGYDVGADLRVNGDTVVTGDVYLTNLFNAFIQQTYDSGTQCTTAAQNNACVLAPGEIYYTQNTNLANERYEGVELGVSNNKDVGLGYNVAAGLQKAYTYNLPPCFYSKTITACSEYDLNLAILPGANSSGNAASTTSGLNGFSNQSIPYLTGNAALVYRSDSGLYATFGDTFYGKNNSYYEKPFGIAFVSLRVPLNKDVSIQVSGDNVFGTLSGLFPINGGGVPIPLAGTLQGSPAGTPATGATYGNVLGPATWRFVITKTFGRTAARDSNGRSTNSSR